MERKKNKQSIKNQVPKKVEWINLNELNANNHITDMNIVIVIFIMIAIKFQLIATIDCRCFAVT